MDSSGLDFTARTGTCAAQTPTQASPGRRHSPSPDEVLTEVGVVGFTWLPGCGQVDWYGDLSGQLALRPRSFEGHANAYLAFVHADQRHLLKQHVRQALRRRAEHVQHSHRVRRHDGVTRVMQLDLVVRRDARGRIECIAGTFRDVTAAQLGETGVPEDQLLREAVARLPVAACLIRRLRIEHANRHFTELMNIDAPRIERGLPFADLVPADAAELRRLWQLRPGQSGGEVVERVVTVRDGTGQLRRMHATLTRAGYGSASYVLALLRSAEPNEGAHALALVQSNLRHVLGVAEAMILMLDVQGRVTLLNRKGRHLLGYRDEELVGQDWFDACVPPERREARRQRHERALKERRAELLRMSNEVVTRCGERRWVAWQTILMHDEQGRVVGSMSSGEDITERRRATESLRAANAELEHRVADRTAELAAAHGAERDARHAAERATQQWGRLVAYTSHEVRTPLGAIAGLADLARRHSALDARTATHLDQIKRLAGSLLDLLDDLLDLAGRDGEATGSRHRAFTIDCLIAHLDLVAAPRAAQKGLAWSARVDADVPRHLLGDDRRIGQVLVNLAGNAIKFTERGTVQLQVSRLPPRGSEGVRVRFSVIDTGIGIDATQLEQLFRPYNTLGREGTRHERGTGLGLAICKQLVESMGGTIEVARTHSCGSEFRIEIPLCIDSMAREADAPAVSQRDPLDRLKGRRVLLVEDDDVMRLVSAEALRMACGAEVDVATSAHAAHRMLQRNGYALVLLDLELPDADGRDFCRTLCADPRVPPVPVMALTGHSLERVGASCAAAGMSAVLPKPLDMADLGRAIAGGGLGDH